MKLLKHRCNMCFLQPMKTKTSHPFPILPAPFPKSNHGYSFLWRNARNFHEQISAYKDVQLFFVFNLNGGHVELSSCKLSFVLTGYLYCHRRGQSVSVKALSHVWSKSIICPSSFFLNGMFTLFSIFC